MYVPFSNMNQILCKFISTFMTCLWLSILAQGEQQISSKQSNEPAVIILEGSIASVMKGSRPPMRSCQQSPFYLARLDEHLYAVDKPAAKVT